jgi:hypothetical protein
VYRLNLPEKANWFPKGAALQQMAEVIIYMTFIGVTLKHKAE